MTDSEDRGIMTPDEIRAQMRDSEKPPRKLDSADKVLIGGVVALALGVGGLLWGFNHEPQPLPAQTVTKTSTTTTATPTTMTKTETRTETPPARTVTETRAARSSVRTPAAPVTPSTNTSDTTTQNVNPTPQNGSTANVSNQSAADCIAKYESGGNPKAENPSGASGLYQFMPGTWTSVTGKPPPASAYSVAEQRAAFDKLWANGAGASHWVTAGKCGY